MRKLWLLALSLPCMSSCALTRPVALPCPIPPPPEPALMAPPHYEQQISRELCRLNPSDPNCKAWVTAPTRR